MFHWCQLGTQQTPLLIYSRRMAWDFLILGFSEGSSLLCRANRASDNRHTGGKKAPSQVLPEAHEFVHAKTKNITCSQVGTTVFLGTNYLFTKKKVTSQFSTKPTQALCKNCYSFCVYIIMVVCFSPLTLIQ